MTEKTTNNTTTSRNESITNNITLLNKKNGTKSVDKNSTSNIVHFTRNNPSSLIYNKFSNNSLIKTKEFDDLITENIPNLSENPIGNNDATWDIHKFTKQNLKNSQISLEDILEHSPKKQQTTENIENNYAFLPTKKPQISTKSFIQNSHISNNSINDDMNDIYSKKKETDGTQNIMTSPSKLKININKSFIPKGYKNSSTDSHNLKEPLKTRNKIHSSVYGTKTNKSKSISMHSANVVKTSRVNQESKTKQSLKKLIKLGQNEDNIVINSFYNDNLAKNRKDNRNETLYLFSKVKAENKKNEEILMKEKKIKEEMNKCTFKPKILPIKKLNDVFRAPSSNLVKYLKISNPKDAKLSYIGRLQEWEKNKKEKKERKWKETQEELLTGYTHKPNLTRSVPKFNNHNEFDMAHKMYMNRVASARKKREEIFKKLNPNNSILNDKSEKRNKTNSCDNIGKTYLSTKQIEEFYKSSQKILHNNLLNFIATYDCEME